MCARRAWVRLCGERNTIADIQHCVMNGRTKWINWLFRCINNIIIGAGVRYAPRTMSKYALRARNVGGQCVCLCECLLPPASSIWFYPLPPPRTYIYYTWSARNMSKKTNTKINKNNKTSRRRRSSWKSVFLFEKWVIYRNVSHLKWDFNGLESIEVSNASERSW